LSVPNHSLILVSLFLIPFQNAIILTRNIVVVETQKTQTKPNQLIIKDKMDDDHNEDFDKDGKLFPQRLMEILSDPSHGDTIMWCPNGRIFTIIDRQKFALTVLPKYFGGKEIKYASFSRKLKRWNFKRVTMKGRGPVSYHHEYFQRDNEALCTQMYCNNIRAKFAVAKSKNDEKKAKTKPSANINGYSPTMVEVIASNSAVKGVTSRKTSGAGGPKPSQVVSSPAASAPVSSNQALQRQCQNLEHIPAAASLGLAGLDPVGLQARALLLGQAGLGLQDGLGLFPQANNLARLAQLQALTLPNPTQDLYTAMLRRQLATSTTSPAPQQVPN